MATTYFDQKLPAMLRRLGVSISLGAESTYGLVDAADQADTAEGATVKLGAHAARIAVAVGTLAGLASGSTVTVNEGPLAGSYRVRTSPTIDADGLQTCIAAKVGA